MSDSKKVFNFEGSSDPEHFQFAEDAQNENVLFNEDTTNDPKQPEEFYKVLIVDDEEDIHLATKIIIRDFLFNNKRMLSLHAYNSMQAIELLQNNPDIAVCFLDVVMESYDSGLQLTQFIREELQNKEIRIILRTGQPGYAPERKVVIDYDINDYKTKTELTANKVISVLVSGLRTFDLLQELRTLNETLQVRVDERTAELQHKNNELDLINRAKDRLFGVIGHDLRGPIGNLKGMLEILETQPDMLRSDSAPAIIAKLHKNASQSYTLLENLLQWAQNEHGLMVFNPEPFDLMNSVYESVALLESASSGKDVHIEILGTVDTLVLGDVRMVNTVLRNLVSNAIKFSDSGTNVQLVLKKQEAFTLVKVIDNGIGIPAENIPILLSQHDVFTTYGTLREKGSGLGLKLAKSFVERNGGEFGVESSVGKGSTFWFTVPLAQS